MNDDERVTFELTQAEALVLFELLARQTPEVTQLQIVHEAERVVLWGVEAILEKQLVQPFKQNYDELLDAARSEVVGSGRET